MFELINDLTLYDIPSLNGEVNSLLLTSEDNESCSLVYKILNCVFSNHVLIFKASGMADEINVLKSYFNNSNLHYFEGDLSKMMIKKFPEFFLVIDNFHTLKHLLNDWVCTIYERRFIYVSSVDKYGNLLKELKKTFSTIQIILLMFGHLSMVSLKICQMLLIITHLFFHLEKIQ